MGTIKPKLGNASALFTESETKGLNSLAPQDPSTRKLVGRVIGVTAIMCLLATVVLYQQSNNSIHAKNVKVSLNTNDEPLAVVHAKDDSSELIGTLVRMDNENSDLASLPEVKLTESERQHLLEILSTH